MKQDQLLGLIRHILTFGGGLLVTKGVLDEGMATELVGALVTIFGGAWSVLAKK